MAEPKRKAHVMRFAGGRGSWVDVLRIDELPVNFQSKTDTGKQTQVIKFKFYWADRPDSPSNGVRKTSVCMIPDPILDPDKDSGLHLDIIKKMKITMPQGVETGASNQVVTYVFNNTVPGSKDADTGAEKPIAKRKVKIYKIRYNDLNDIDSSRAQKLYSEGVDWDTYKEWLADEKAYIDHSTYLLVEFPSSFSIQFGSDASNGWQGQIIKYTLNNKDVVDSLKLEDPIEHLSDPYTEGLVRTDPLQIIINHGFTAFGGINVTQEEHIEEFCSLPVDNGPGSVNTMSWVPSMPLFTIPGFYIFEHGPGFYAYDKLAKQTIWPDGRIHISQTCTKYGNGTLKAYFFGPDGKIVPDMASISPSSWSADKWQYRESGANRPDFDPFSPENITGSGLQSADGTPVVARRFPGDDKPYLVVGTLSMPFGQYGNSIGGPDIQWVGGPPPGYVPPPYDVPGGDVFAYTPFWQKETEHLFSYGGADDTYGVALSSGTQPPTPRISGGSVTVSGATFKCGGKTYQAKGLVVDPETHRPPGGGYSNITVYCERIDPDS